MELEIPSITGISWLRTLEGVFDKTIEDLKINQPTRKYLEPEY